jgi:hypothetical protein
MRESYFFDIPSLKVGGGSPHMNNLLNQNNMIANNTINNNTLGVDMKSNMYQSQNNKGSA